MRRPFSAVDCGWFRVYSGGVDGRRGVIRGGVGVPNPDANQQAYGRNGPGASFLGPGFRLLFGTVRVSEFGMLLKVLSLAA